MQPPVGNAMRANTTLASCLAKTGLTQAGLADAINSVVEDLTGAPGRASDRWVRMLVDGSIRWPRNHYRQALETVLHARIDELGFHDPRGAISTGDVVPQTTAFQARLSTADVARLRKPLNHLVASADRCGAATLAPQAAQHAAAVQDMLRNAVVSERVERAMYVLVGDYLAGAGWFALDSGDPLSAQRHLDAALRAAGLARDGSLQAYVWSVTEKSARLRADYGHALAAARAGLALATARRDLRVRGVFHALTAMNLSKRGETAQAQHSLARAVEALGSATTVDLAAGRWSFASPAFVAATGASVSLALGQLRKAEYYSHQAIEATQAGQTRNHALRQLSLARIYVEMRELEAACAHASSVLAVADQMSSHRLIDQLKHMRKLLDPWHTVSVVHDWNTQYHHYFRRIRPTAL